MKGRIVLVDSLSVEKACPAWYSGCIISVHTVILLAFLFCFYIYFHSSLLLRADRAEMARNAQTFAPAYPAPSDVTVVKTSAPSRPQAPWEREAPPPAYTDLQSNTVTGRVGWDTSYLQSSTADLSAGDPYRNTSSNPASSDKPIPNQPYNPFQ